MINFVRASGNSGCTSSGNTSSIAPPWGAITPGNAAAYLIFDFSAANTLLSVTDNAAGVTNAYSITGTFNLSSIAGLSGSAALACCPRVQGSPTRLDANWTNPSGGAVSQVNEYSGVASVGTLLTPTAQAAATSFSQAIADAIANSVVLSGIWYPTGPITPGSGFSLRSNSAGTGCASEDQLFAAPGGTVNMTWNDAVSEAVVIGGLVLAPASRQGISPYYFT